MIIKERIEERPEEDSFKSQDGDILDIKALNQLGTCVAVLYGDFRVMVESICVQTGLCRFDVCGKIDLGQFSDIKTLIDFNGNEHDPDDYYLE